MKAALFGVYLQAGKRPHTSGQPPRRVTDRPRPAVRSADNASRHNCTDKQHDALKVLKGIVNFLVWTTVCLYIGIIVVVHIPQVQSYIGERAAALLSETIGAEVNIGRVDVGFLNRLVIDDVTIYDQSGTETLRAARLTAGVDMGGLAKGRVIISAIQIFGAHITLYKPTADSPTNIQFIIDAFSSNDTTKTSVLNLQINSLIVRHTNLRYDILDAPRTDSVFNPSHIYVKDISTHATLHRLTNDSIALNVRNLAFTEQSGLNVRKIAIGLEANKGRCTLSGFTLVTPRSELTFDSLHADYSFVRDTFDLSSLRIADARCTLRVTPADFAALCPPLSVFDAQYAVSAALAVNGRSADISQLSIHAADGSLSFNGYGQLRDNNGRMAWAAVITSFNIAPSLTDDILTCAGATDRNAHDIVSRTGTVSFAGELASHHNGTLSADGTMTTDAGAADIALSLSGDSTARAFDCRVSTASLSVQTLTGSGTVGSVSAEASASGTLNGKTLAAADFQASVRSIVYGGKTYTNISADCAYDGGIASGTLAANDPKLTFTATYETDTRARSVNDAVGSLHVSQLYIQNDDDTLAFNDAEVNAGFEDGVHYITFNGDFGTAELKGDINPATIASLGDIDRIGTVPAGNNFTLSAEMTSSEWMETFLGVPLSIDGKVTASGELRDTTNTLCILCDMPHFFYDGSEYRDGAVTLSSPSDTLHGTARITKIMNKGTIMQLGATAAACHDKIGLSLTWDNDAKTRQSGIINAEAQFTSGGANGRTVTVDVLPSHVNIGDTLWTIHPSQITYSKEKISIDSFAVTNNDQHIIINGVASAAREDTLWAELNDINIEYILDLVNFHTVEFSGYATGEAYATAPLKDMEARASLRIDRFLFEQGRLGTLYADVAWNNRDKRIELTSKAVESPTENLDINGYITPSPGYIDLDMYAMNTNIEFMKSYTSAFLDRIEGRANGAVKLSGPMKDINLTGELTVDGNMHLSTTNCDYTFEGDTVVFIPDEIIFNNMAVHDVKGNEGIVTGALHHRHLTRLTYDINVEASNLLSYDTREFGEEGFYGTVYGNGKIDMHGRSGELLMNIDITPQENSVFVYNVASPEGISGREFITWQSGNDNAPDDTTAVTDDTPDDPKSITTDMHINFLINCTPDATLKLLMDSNTGDYITFNGNGTLRASYYNKGDFNIYGTYIVERGTYDITIQDFIKKNFTFNEGSTLLFSGNPFEAALNLQAVHTVNGVSLSDLGIGNSYTSNTVRVNCLMNIGGIALSPTVDFDIDIPSVSTDEKEMIKSVINSEEEMSRQVVYLLGIGRFYPSESNNASAQSERQKSNTSLAMQSFLSGTLSSQINNMLSTMINSKNWNFGANISTGDDGWDNAEYAGQLSGRMFNNRLLIDGEFGYRDNATTSNTSFIGDFDIRYLLFPNGNLSLTVYNKTNDRYFTKSSLNTQGIGLLMKKDFTNLSDLFGKKKKKSDKDY